METIITRKIRRHRKIYPYSYPLLFMALVAIESLLKAAVVVIVMLAAYYYLVAGRAVDRSSIPDTSALPPKMLSVSENDPSIGLPELEILAGANSKVSENTVAAELPGLLQREVVIKRDQAGIDWVYQLGPSDYIIQLAATPDEPAILEFAREFLPSGSVIYPFKRTPSGRPVFGIASVAVFNSFEDAQLAIARFPQSLRQSDPWIRPAAQIKRAVIATLASGKN